MWSHWRARVGLLEMLSVVYDSDLEKISSLTSQDCSQWLEALAESLDGSVVTLIQLTCVCDGAPVRRNQRLWAVALRDSQVLQLDTKVERGEDGEDDLLFRNVQTAGALGTVGAWESVKALMANHGEDAIFGNGYALEGSPVRRLRHHVNLLELLVALSRGRDDALLEVLEDSMGAMCLDVGDMNRIIGMQGIPYTMRSVYCKLLVETFVDEDPHTLLGPLPTTKVLPKLLEEEERAFRPHSPGEDSVAEGKHALREVVLDLMVAEQNQHRADPFRNLFVEQLVSLVLSMLRFGFYHSKLFVPDLGQIRRLAIPTLQILSEGTGLKASGPIPGKKAVTQLFEGMVPASELKGTEQVRVRVKMLLLDMIEFFFHCADDARTDVLVALWASRLTSAPIIAPKKVQGTTPTMLRSIPSTVRSSWKESVTHLKARISPGRKSETMREDLEAFVREVWVDKTLTLIPELSLPAISSMFDDAFKDFVPQWIRVLLGLLHHDTQELSEKAVALLIASSNQHLCFYQHVSTVLVVTQPKALPVVRSLQVAALRLWPAVRKIQGGEEGDSTREGRRVACAVLTEWVEAMQGAGELSEGGQVCLREVQRYTSSLGCHRPILQLLTAGLQGRGGDGGVLEINTDFIEVLNLTVDALAEWCRGDGGNQAEMLRHSAVMEAYLPIEGVHVERLMEAVVKGNKDILKDIGGRWINMAFDRMKNLEERGEESCGQSVMSIALLPLVVACVEGEAGGDGHKIVDELAMLALEHLVESQGVMGRLPDLLSVQIEKVHIERLARSNADLPQSLTGRSSLIFEEEREGIRNSRKTRGEAESRRGRGIAVAVLQVAATAARTQMLQGRILARQLASFQEILYLLSKLPNVSLKHALPQPSGEDASGWVEPMVDEGWGRPETGKDGWDQCLLLDLRGGLITLLHHAFLNRSSRPLISELNALRTGINSFHPTRVPLLLAAAHELEHIVRCLQRKAEQRTQALLTVPEAYHSMPHSQDDKRIEATVKREWEAHCRYVSTALIPMLTSYFEKLNSVQRESVLGRGNGEDTAGMQRMLVEAAHTVVDGEADWLAAGLAADTLVGECRLLLQAMDSVPARFKPIGFVRVAIPKTNLNIPNAQCQTLQASFQRLQKEIGDVLGFREGTKMVGVGHRQIAAMLSWDVPVPPAIDHHYHQSGHDHGQPLYVGESILRFEHYVLPFVSLCRAPGVSPSTLVDVLRILTATIFISNPLGTPKGSAVSDVRWEAFLTDQCPTGLREGQSDFSQRAHALLWVQSKLDRMGCTNAGLLLFASEHRSVRSAAARLLLALLHGRNPTVLDSVYLQLSQASGSKFLSAAQEVLSETKQALKNYSGRPQRQASMVSPDMAFAADSASHLGTMRHLEIEQSWDHRGGDEEEEAADQMLGRGGDGMMTLRLLQLMAESQRWELRKLLEGDGVVVDLVGGVAGVLEEGSNALEASLQAGDRRVGVLVMQGLETLQGLMSGSGHGAKARLLERGFPNVINRMLGTLSFASTAAARVPQDITINDLRCWLRIEVMKCILAMLDCQDSTLVNRMVGALDSRNVMAQLITTAKLLGLVEGLVDEQNDPIWRAPIPSSPFKDMLSLPPRSAFGNTKIGTEPVKELDILARRNSSTNRLHTFIGSITHSSHGFRDMKLLAAAQFSDGYRESLREELFAIFHVLKTIDNVHKEESLHLHCLQRDFPKLHRFLDRNSKDVELLDWCEETGETRVKKKLFCVSKHMTKLLDSSDWRDKTAVALFDIPRDNPQEKVREFIKRVREVLFRGSWLKSLSSNTFRMASRTKFQIRKDFLEATPFVLSCVITLLLLLTYGIPMDPHTSRPLAGGNFVGYVFDGNKGLDDPYTWADRTTDADGIGRTYISVLTHSDLALKFRLRLQTRWESKAEWEYWPAGKALIWALGFLHMLSSMLNTCSYILQDYPMVVTNCICKPALKTKKTHRDKGPDLAQWRSQSVGKFAEYKKPLHTNDMMKIDKKLVWAVLATMGPLTYKSLMCIVSLLGLLLSPFFWVVGLLDLFKLSYGELFLRALGLGGRNMLQSLVLGIVVIVIVGFYDYSYFSDTINENQNICHGPFQCVVAHIVSSINGDISTTIGNNYGNFDYSALEPIAGGYGAWRSWVVIVAIIWWRYLIQGVIQGQIVDAFAEMRNRRRMAEDNLENCCFITSLDRFAFQGFPEEWEKRRGGRYAWNYLAFFQRLTECDDEELDWLERQVKREYLANNVDFMPIGRLLVTEQARKGDGIDQVQAATDMVKGLMGDVHTLGDRVSGVEESLRGISAQLAGIAGNLNNSRAGNQHAQFGRTASDGSSGDVEAADNVSMRQRRRSADFQRVPSISEYASQTPGFLPGSADLATG